MAKQLPFTDASGNAASASYWRPTTIVIDVVEQTASITLRGYKDKAARDAGKLPLTGAVKQFRLEGAAFTAAYAAHLAGKKNLAQIAYEQCDTDPLFEEAVNV